MREGLSAYPAPARPDWPTRLGHWRLASPDRGRGRMRAEGAGTPLAVGPPADPAKPVLRKNQNLNCNYKVQQANRNAPLPHDVAHFALQDPTYNWRLDAYHCYLLAMRLKGLAIGSIGPTTPAEMYWAEAHGVIP